jgi:hypothetical protein
MLQRVVRCKHAPHVVRREPGTEVVHAGGRHAVVVIGDQWCRSAERSDTSIIDRKRGDDILRGGDAYSGVVEG